MKLLPVVVLGGGIALAAVWYKKQGDAVVKEVQPTFKELKKPVVTLLYTDVIASIEIYNPALISVTVQSLVGGLYDSTGKQFSTFNYSKPFTIPETGNTVIDIACKVNNLTMGGQLFTMLKDWFTTGNMPVLKNMGLVLKGDIYVGTIPVSFEYNV